MRPPEQRAAAREGPGAGPQLGLAGDCEAGSVEVLEAPLEMGPSFSRRTSRRTSTFEAQTQIPRSKNRSTGRSACAADAGREIRQESAVARGEERSAHTIYTSSGRKSSTLRREAEVQCARSAGRRSSSLCGCQSGNDR